MDDKLWRQRFFLRLPLAVLLFGWVLSELAGLDLSLPRFIALAFAWALPVAVYLFAVRTVTVSVLLGFLLLVAADQWLPSTAGMDAIESFALAFLLMMIASAGVLLDLVVMAIGRMLSRRSSSA
jgi:hypothetical protein